MPHGKRLVAKAMFEKGQTFVAASILLRQNNLNQSAALQLLCQGIEVSLKGLLLLIDYDQFRPRLRAINHNLLAAADETLRAAKMNSLTPKLRSELTILSTLYSKHLLRYGSIHDVLVNPQTISYELVLRRLHVAFRLVRRARFAA